MIPDNLEYLFEEQGYEFYCLEEYGFSYKKMAKKAHLFENFGNSLSSTYYEIYTVNLYENIKLSQIWIFKDQNPVGLSIGVHYDKLKNITDTITSLSTTVVGQINLFVLPEHRGKGLASKTIPLLEDLFLTTTDFPPSIILQDKAYGFKKLLQYSYPLPVNCEKYVSNKNKQALSAIYQKVVSNKNLLEELCENFPLLDDQYKRRQNIIYKIKNRLLNNENSHFFNIA